MLMNMTGVQGEETSEEALLQRALAMSMDRWGLHRPLTCSPYCTA